MRKDKIAGFADFALRVHVVTGILALIMLSYGLWSAFTRSFVDPRVMVGFGFSVALTAGGRVAVGLAARRARS